MSEPWDGLEVWRLEDRSGAVLLITALDAFTVRREGGKGPSFEFTNIVIGEPEASLHPPESATVRDSAEPMRVGRAGPSEAGSWALAGDDRETTSHPAVRW